MPGGGGLTICGRVREQEWKPVITGIGVPAGVDVVQLFMKTEPGASVLGLPITVQIIASRGGRIQRIPERAPGTTFEILLPRCPTFMIPSSTVNE
jgi:signal transduction histidine kinase